VFVLAPTTLNISSAEEYGDLTYIYTTNDRMPSVFSLNFGVDALSRMEDNNYDPDRDYVLVAGVHVALIQWISVVISEHEWCRGLLFDSTRDAYIDRTLGIPESTANGSRRNDVVSVQ
jgi:hypothetical protein